MESNEAHSGLTPDQAQAALAAADDVQTRTQQLSATPWPLWFTVVITIYAAAYPILFGGSMSDSEWLLPRVVWGISLLTSVAVYFALFAYAAREWRRRTGVALRLDVLPARLTVPVFALYLGAVFGGIALLKATGQMWLLFVASAIGAAMAIGFHLLFVRLHRGAAA